MQLTDILKKETASLKVQYLAMTEEWAKSEYARLCTVKESDIVNARGFKNRYGRMEHTKASYAYFLNIDRIVRNSLDIFVANSLGYASNHYEDSILKLADRIQKKGLDETKITVKTAHIGVNIETVLTDGIKSVKAFTIIAEGEIQRPHYRYLIK